ncbi:uncharacterized protein LOC131241325 [Magnolia sinica]|uniref:uncharacterized protein LOC131241325 n=1 Tax=Magnolia sinica TaxID=86752 RepID=UPI002659B6A3|nr:uncharacterized protein LOC131241325 [Magnolia sinica]
MEFSDQWKSLWSIASVFPAPLLLASSETSSFGPLHFYPTLSPPTILFSSPSLSPQIPPSLHPSIFRRSVRSFFESSKTSFIPSSLLNSISLPPLTGPQPPPISRNSLHSIRRPNSDLILFFSTGPNSDCIGYVVFSPTNQQIWTDKDADVFKLQLPLDHRILMISAIDAATGPSMSGNSVTEGFLLVCTLYSVHWIKVETRVSSSNHLDRPILVHLASVEFKVCVLQACWNPHMQEESMVLLESGELRLFDLSQCLGVSRLPVKLRGTRVKVSESDLAAGSLDSGKGDWLSCEFSWHPRILIVACSTAVYLVDLRFEQSSVTVLAKIEMCDSIQVHSLQTDRFIALCKASFDDFYFSVATKYNLLLFDTRQPLMPVLKWDHNLNSPCYIDMHRLSELRPSMEDGAFKSSSEFGFAILAGSFWNCEFSLFFYGPPLPASGASIASKISKLGNSLYAWDLPSALSLSGRECRCGNCLVREDFSKAMLPVGVDWQLKKEMVLGFCILPEYLFLPKPACGLENAPEDNGLGGFTLIRLMSSGKLELQRYRASCDFVGIKCDRKEASLHFEDSLLYSWDQEDDAPTKCHYLKLDNLSGHLNGNLADVLASKMQNHHLNRAGTEQGDTRKISYTRDARELIRDRLKVAGVDPIGSFPATVDVLSSINFPTSIHEIASSRIWSGLQLDLLQMAFFKHLDLLMCQTDRWVEFLDVPGFPPGQMPPFFLRKPSRRSEKWPCKAEQGDTLAGPVLPLTVLLTLHQISMGSTFGPKGGVDGFSMETELTNHCNEFINMANDLLSCDDTHSVSLASDNEKWVASQEVQCQKTFFFYEPKAHLDAGTMCHEKNNTAERSVKEESNQTDRVSLPHLVPGSTVEDKKFTTFVSRIQYKASSPNDGQENIGLEMFDDLSPVQLKFDSPAMNFGPEELNVYKCLKRQFSKWQESFKPYEDFCTSNKIPKQT